MIWEIGDVVEVTPIGAMEFALPAGLPGGAQVRIVREVAGGKVLVERDGREWTVYTMNLMPKTNDWVRGRNAKHYI